MMNDPKWSAMNSLALSVLPGRISRDSADRAIYDRMFQFWISFWRHEMKVSGGDRRYVLADDLLRQNGILVVHSQDKIVSMMLNTIYNPDIEAERNTKYFSDFSASAVAELVEPREPIYTMEFLAVDPAFRGAKIGASLSAVMINLSLRRAGEMGIKKAIGVARVDNKVNRTAFKYGAKSLGEVVKVNIKCEVVAMDPAAADQYPDGEVVALADRLWRSRRDATETKPIRHLRVA